MRWWVDLPYQIFKRLLAFFLDLVQAWSRPFLLLLLFLLVGSNCREPQFFSISLPSQHLSPAYGMRVWLSSIRIDDFHLHLSGSSEDKGVAVSIFHTGASNTVSMCETLGRRFLSWVLDKGPYWRSVFSAGLRWVSWKEGKGVLFQWMMVVNTFQHECLVHRCWQSIWVPLSCMP